MRVKPDIHLQDVQAVYSGPEGRLWELVMGEQIHIGGALSSTDLAERAAIEPDTTGVDLCCCTGAGMRFLVRLRNVRSMTGVDATDAVIERGRERCQEQQFDGLIRFVRAEATATGLPGGSFDFVWGEDAWCYVEDKPALIREAARIVRPGGTIAFTDWVEGDTPLSPAEAERFMGFMKFPSFATVPEYRDLLESNECRVAHAADTGRFTPYVDLYLGMLTKQLTYDALRILGFDDAFFQSIGKEILFLQQLAREGKIVQGLFVAQKPQ